MQYFFAVTFSSTAYFFMASEFDSNIDLDVKNISFYLF